MITFGILGCGMAAHYHAVAISALEESFLAGVCAGKSTRLDAFCKQHRTKSFSSYESMLSDPSVDAVAICTPSGYHYENALAALRAGKHIVIEKPICLSTRDADALQLEAEKSGKVVSIISQNRFSDGAAELKRAIMAGELGKVISVTLSMNYYRDQSYYDNDSWRGTKEMDGGGVLMNQGIHGVDMLVFLLGKVDSVCAYSGTLLRNIEVEDTLCAALHFENGSMGVINATVCSRNPRPMRLEICAEKGNAVIQGKDIVFWGLENPCKIPVRPAPEFDCFNASPPVSFENHIRQYRDILSAICSDNEPSVTLLDGRYALSIVQSLYESARTEKIIRIHN